MMTEQELSALVELLNRTPMTGAERQWTQAMINRLLEGIRSQQEAKRANLD